MLTAPLFGALAARWPRLKWKLIAVGVLVWSLATGAGGLAASFLMLLMTRCFVGVGEGAYGPLAPTILSDCFPVAKRGKILSLFYVAMPVGGALGYALGGFIAKLGSGPRELAVGVLRRRDPGIDPGDPLALDARVAHRCGRRGLHAQANDLARLPDPAPHALLRARYAGHDGDVVRHGGLGLVDARLPGIASRSLSVWASSRGPYSASSLPWPGWAGPSPAAFWATGCAVRLPGSYFLVSGAGLLLSAPCVLLFLVMPFPWAWCMIFAAVFFMFVNTGPTNAILANVVHPVMRPAGFAVNILVIHVLGDVISPPIIGAVAGYWNMSVGFVVVSAFLAIGGLLWLWGGRYLDRDTEIAPQRLA